MSFKSAFLAAVLALMPFAAVAADESVPRASLQPGQVFRDCATCPEMVVIPPGVIEMGFPGDHPRELQRFTIAKPFAIGRFELKRSEYAAFVKTTGFRERGCQSDISPEWDKLELNWRNPNFKQDDTHPVVCMSWKAVQTYLKWLSKKTGKTYRVPSLVEWTRAAYADVATIFPWGDKFDYDYANVDSFAFRDPYWREDARDQWAFTSPVGSFPPNGFGLFDVIGNLAEWVADCTFRDSDAKGRLVPTDGSPWVVPHCVERLTAGGSFDTPPDWTARPESGIDRWFEKSGGAIWVGLRVVRNL